MIVETIIIIVFLQMIINLIFFREIKNLLYEILDKNK